MKIYKITEASEYLGVSINTLKTLGNNGKIKSFKTTGEHRRFRQEDLDAKLAEYKEKIKSTDFKELFTKDDKTIEFSQKIQQDLYLPISKIKAPMTI